MEKKLLQMMAAVLQEADRTDAVSLTDALKGARMRMLTAAEAEFGPNDAGLPCSSLISQGCDLLVATVASALQVEGGRGVAWVAIGGYGRGLMSPGSTVRLMVLHDGADLEAARSKAAQTVSGIRSAGLSAIAVPHTVPEALRAMRQDCVDALSMLDTRLVAGHAELYERFESAVSDRFMPECWGSFCEEALREALSPRDPFTGSPYCIEPNLKDGAGGLRDIGTAQKVSGALLKVDTLAGFQGLLSTKESCDLENALDFVLRVRNKLHFLHGNRSDVLYRAAHADVARALGVEAQPAGEAARQLMHRLFTHTGAVAGLLRALNERFLHLHRVAWRRPAAMPVRRLKDGFAEVGASLYNSCDPPFEQGQPAARLMRLFLLSQRRHLPVSDELLRQVRAHLHLVDDAFREDIHVGDVFLDLLAGSVGVADRIAWMRDCGLLQAYLPEFAPLVHAMDHDGASDHSLDEHAVEALRVIDELGHSSERSELGQREVLEKLERPDLLRLAVLLHDVDVAAEVAPEEAAARVAERIGLRKPMRADLQFLMLNRSMLWKQVENLRAGRLDAVKEVARSVGSAVRLQMLYLLSYAHARAMGPLGWFAWRDAQLYGVYQTLMAELVPGYTPFATAEYFDRELIELAPEKAVADQARQFAALVPELYKSEVTPAEALGHLELLRRAQDQQAAMSAVVGAEQAVAWVCTSDVPARFAQIAAAFTYNGLDIVSATAFTLGDGTVLDRFAVHKKGQPINPDPAHWREIEKDLVLSIQGKLDVGQAVLQKADQGRLEPDISSRRQITTVHFDNESDVPFTILDIVTWDRTGLLFDISRTLSEMGLNIEMARVRTRGELAQDVFYLSDSATGEPVAKEQRLAAIRQALLRVTTAGAGVSPNGSPAASAGGAA